MQCKRPFGPFGCLINLILILKVTTDQSCTNMICITYTQCVIHYRPVHGLNYSAQLSPLIFSPVWLIFLLDFQVWLAHFTDFTPAGFLLPLSKIKSSTPNRHGMN